MEQRMYRGHIDPDQLADHLVRMFHQQPVVDPYHHYTIAQKMKRDEQVFVQIMHASDWGRNMRNSLGIQIVRVAGGISVSMGESNWLDLDEGGLAGMLLGALLFPPLLILPVIRGLSRSAFSQDVWDVIEAYCIHTGERAEGGRAPQGFYCPYCGVLNHPGAIRCHACAAPFDFASPSSAASSQPLDEQAEQSVSAARSSLEHVVCSRCGATVAAAKFCGNCAASLCE